MSSELATTETAGQDGGALAIAQTRAAQEVQAQMIIAQNFPRDETKAFDRILKACKRQGLAEASQYSYSRGGTPITGPSIRLAETMAQCWGNLDFGIQELEQKNGESVVQAYCHDLETNTRQVKTFTVPHRRDTKNGSYALTDARDIYEAVANNGARRLRACILGIIPGDIADAAVAACNKTLTGDGSKPLEDQIRAMVAACGELGITTDALEAKLGHKIGATTPAELANIRKQFVAIRDGFSKAHEVFPDPSSAPAEGQSLKDRIRDKQGKSAPEGEADLSDFDNLGQTQVDVDEGQPERGSPESRYADIVAGLKGCKTKKAINDIVKEASAEEEFLGEELCNKLGLVVNEEMERVQAEIDARRRPKDSLLPEEDIGD